MRHFFKGHPFSDDVETTIMAKLPKSKVMREIWT